MSVGGVGGVGAMGGMAAGAGVGAAAALGTGGANGPLGDLNAGALSAASGTRIDQLLQLLDGFSSAEILIALMLSGASGHHHRKHDCGDAGMGFLLGLSLAAQLGQSALQLPGNPSGGVTSPAATGQSIDASA